MPELGRVARYAGGALAGALLLAASAQLSRWPAGRPAEASELRLAMRTAIARLEICRDRTSEELAALPAHLRALRICSETAIDYRLVVLVDGETRLDRTVRHRGVRHTRPLAVDLAIAVDPGRRLVDVRFEPDDAMAAAKAATGLTEEYDKLPQLRLTAEMDFSSGRARLVHINEGGVLEVVPEPGAALQRNPPRTKVTEQ